MLSVNTIEKWLSRVADSEFNILGTRTASWAELWVDPRMLRCWTVAKVHGPTLKSAQDISQVPCPRRLSQPWVCVSKTATKSGKRFQNTNPPKSVSWKEQTDLEMNANHFFVLVFSEAGFHVAGWPWIYRVSRMSLNSWFSCLHFLSTRSQVWAITPSSKL